MTVAISVARKLTRGEQDELFKRASAAWERGETRPAFRLFRLAANAGDDSAQLNLGYFFDQGVRVRVNKEKALYWYRRAYRRGNASAATSIGLIFRERRQYSRALEWLQRARRRGNADSGLHIAEIYAERGKFRTAVKYLKQVNVWRKVTWETQRRAERLLRKYEKSG